MAFNNNDYIKTRHKIAPYSSMLFSKMLVEADRRIQKHKRFVKKIEEAKMTSTQKFNEPPKKCYHTEGIHSMWKGRL